MKLISRRFHAVLDYLSAVVLAAAPWFFGFADVGNALMVSISAGVFVLIVSLLTAYPGGVVRTLSMATHLNLDILLGIILALSPWIFGFHEQVYLPHLILGLFSIFAGAVTNRAPWNRQVRKAGV
ncbi:SPW repeat protein [Pedobacter sp. SYP-B3415]|uniref:SPW repeat domain-containing protein n=1 Tax=Pedobacter sp. SYP-B3415 TaxID=2496641 RepID=UPI00101D5530|nr:SPW repeat protein [Pedobacter sp. SYP-B3415]